jgi:hypothetical protein
MRAYWPRLLLCELQAIHKRMQEDLCKRICLAARAAAVSLPDTDAAIASPSSALMSRAPSTQRTATLSRTTLTWCASASTPYGLTPTAHAATSSSGASACSTSSARAPALVAYLADWAAADARDEDCVRAALLDHDV